MFPQYSTVKVVALSKPLCEYDSWGTNRRSPAVGDIGAIVEILRSASDEIMYVVECVNPDGTSEWLSDFSESELVAHET